MKKLNVLKSIFSVFGKVIKIGTIIGGIFLIIRKKDSISGFFKKSNFIIAATYGILLSLIALIYRLIVALHWIIQQAR